MSDEKVLFLVEHLPRIGATSILLEGVVSPRLSLSDGYKIEVRDETGKVTIIPLPTRVISNTPLTPVRTNSNCFSLRLKSRPQDLAAYSSVSKAQNIFMSLPEGKWSKKELHECGDFEIKCLKCHFDIIDKKNCKRLSELPSEFWQELMDYWHCHKPHQPSQEIWYSTKYNTLQPDVGEIVIGGSFFLMQPATLAGRIEIVDGILQCPRCRATLGDESTGLCKVRKWQVLLSTTERHEDLFPPEQDVVFTLLNLLKGYSTRYVQLSSGESQLFVWIFAIGLDVILSNNQVLKNSIKILFRQKMSEEEVRKYNVEKVDVESLPMQSFMQSLQCYNKLLPHSARSFGEWEVAYATFAD